MNVPALLVPPAVVTVTFTAPADPAGSLSVICVPALLTVKFAALISLLPKLTSVAPVKPLPVIVTGVPPAVGPELGATVGTFGAAT